MLVLSPACGGSAPVATDAGVVDAALPDAAWPDAAPPPPELFDESVILTYEFDVAAADWRWLNDNAELEEYVSATMRVGGEVVADAAVRYKGSYGSLFFCFDELGNLRCDKLSIKVAFDQANPDGRFHGLRKLNLHAMEADPTRMHDAIGYRLFRDLGVPAPRTAYARVIVNGELLGLFAVVEQIDGRFTRATFPDGGEGNLYKEIWPEHLTAEPYLAALQTNEDQNPSVDKMQRFAAALAAGGDAGFAAVVGEWMDVDLLVRYMAVARLIDHWDDIVAWYCSSGPCWNHNFYWYESATEDRLWLVAWDLDHTFEEPSPIRSRFGMPDWDDVAADCTPLPIFIGIHGRAPACDPFIRGMATQLWDRYAEESRLLLDGAFSIAAMNARIDELAALIRAELADDPNGPSLLRWEASVDELRDIVVAKRNHVAAKL